jgi:ribosomal protein S18 acetylase RimI-like enzyme
MTAADVPRCAAFTAELELQRRYGVTEASARRQLEAALSSGRAELLVAEREGSVIGYAWFIPRGAFDRSGYLRLLAVASPYHGQGIGAALLAELEDKHLAAGGIVLLASTFNTRAHRFYERMGYRQVGLIPAYVGPGLDERVYFKPARAG